MYAVVQVGGRQYRARPGERLVVDRMAVSEGQAVELGDVRMLVAEEGDGFDTTVGRPAVAGARVTATAVSHRRGPKIVVFKYKPKKRYRRTRGFRAELTELLIDEVLAPGQEPAGEQRTPERRSSSGEVPAAPEVGAPQLAPPASVEAGTAPEDLPAGESGSATARAARSPRRRRVPAGGTAAGAAGDGPGGGVDGS